MKYRKKPVVIEAFQVEPNDDKSRRLPPGWLMQAIVGGSVVPLAEGGLDIQTLEGTMRANVGDWVIRGVKGELYPCKDDIFVATYDPAISFEECRLMQKYRVSVVGHDSINADHTFDAYSAALVDAALAAKDARIADLEKLITQLTATGESLCERLDQVHLMAATPAPFSHWRAILGEIADMTIGYGPAESHKVVE